MSEATSVVERDDTPNVANQMIQVIERAAANPDVPVEKMERILDMQERILDRQNAQDFAIAMSKAQADMPAIVARAWNDQTKSYYAKLGDIVQSITPVYTKHGISLSFSQGTSELEQHIRVVCDITHQSGYSTQRWIDVPVVNTGLAGKVNMTMTHATASAFSYGRRYLVGLIFNLGIAEDDDGNAAGRETKCISDEQVAALEEFFAADAERNKDTEAWREKVYQWAGVESLHDIAAKDYKQVFAGIKKAFEARGAGK